MASDFRSETPEESLARLQRGATSSPTNSANSNEPRYAPRLEVTRGGYRIPDVDDFLDGVHHRTPTQVQEVMFRTIRLARGYKEDVVDALLDDITEWLRAGEDVRKNLASWSAPSR